MLLQYFGSIFWFLAYFSRCIGSMDLKLPGAHFQALGYMMVQVDYTQHAKNKFGSFWPKTVFSVWPISGSFFSAIAQILPGAKLRIVGVYMVQKELSQYATPGRSQWNNIKKNWLCFWLFSRANLALSPKYCQVQNFN